MVLPGVSRACRVPVVTPENTRFTNQTQRDVDDPPVWMTNTSPRASGPTKFTNQLSSSAGRASGPHSRTSLGQASLSSLEPGAPPGLLGLGEDVPGAVQGSVTPLSLRSCIAPRACACMCAWLHYKGAGSHGRRTGVPQLPSASCNKFLCSRFSSESNRVCFILRSLFFFFFHFRKMNVRAR